MKNFNQVKAGKYRVKGGREFEERFQAYCNLAEHVDLIRIPDGCKVFGLNKLVRVRSPLDFVLFYKDNAVFCDTKTCLENTYGITDKVAFQIENFRIADSHNQASGFLIEFRERGEYRWYSYKRLKEILVTRKSLTVDLGLLVGETFPMQIDFEKIINDCA